MCLVSLFNTAAQGGSLASAFENVVRTSHLNVTKNLMTSMGPQFLLQTALYARIGTSPSKRDGFLDGTDDFQRNDASLLAEQ